MDADDIDALPTDWLAEPDMIARLLATDPRRYGRTRNHLNGAVTGLSRWITHGVAPLPQVVHWLCAARGMRPRDKLAFEFAWREYFHHVWSRHGDAILADLRPGVRAVRYSEALPAALREGRTGLPPIDCAVRHLYEDGHLHNHARMWLAAFVVHYLKVAWRTGADWMYGHLLDGDLASNHLSWQWVTGTFSRRPYLFNAENVARYAPSEWHCPGSALDQSYQELEALARSNEVLALMSLENGIAEPPLLAEPPPELLHDDDGRLPATERDRALELIHPFHLRPALEAPAGALRLGIVHLPFHRQFPWSAKRWAFVLPRMRRVCERIYVGDVHALEPLADGRHIGAEVTHYPGYREALTDLCTQLREPPRWLPNPPRPSPSFSHFWKRCALGETCVP